ncbi:hypothetical protein C2845_PM02G37110 [Panicum miliaceum]|uniref:FAD-binding domain-containing protein n=1 Tax=Panicum miliaceum TaxID=4540 RepID=A0A3L6SBT2_PANMI|nr:hypothetical protein C2845_PM02G37110 [Panicum miliaceum]
MAAVEDIVIAGAGLAGLATALGKGVRSLVLESSPTLRASGFAFTTWTNAFRALDALGVGDKIREHHLLYESGHDLGLDVPDDGEVVGGEGVYLRVQGDEAVTVTQIEQLVGQWSERDTAMPTGGMELCLLLLLHRMVTFSAATGEAAAKTLENELPKGTIRYSSKIVAIEEDGNVTVLHLADGSTMKTKVLIGCDGVNSVVAKWLGLPKPILSGRSATRGLAEYPAGHGFGPEILQFIGQGFRSGVLPCSDTSVYWNYTWYPSPADGDAEESVAKMRSFVLAKLRGARIPAGALDVIERSEMSEVVSSPLRFRSPLALVRGSISRGGVCVAGDALHPMMPELGQGGCAALEDGVVLARCLGDAFAAGHEGVAAALGRYAEARRWRSVQLITAAYVVGFIQQSNNVVVKFLRDTFLSPLLAKTLVAMADYDCGTL